MTARNPSIDATLSLTAYHARMPVGRLIGPSKRRLDHHVRIVAVATIRERFGVRDEEIGAHLNGRSGRLIRTSLKQAAALLAENAGWRALKSRVLADLVEPAQ